jgi:hypothetical protein
VPPAALCITVLYIPRLCQLVASVREQRMHLIPTFIGRSIVIYLRLMASSPSEVEASLASRPSSLC